MRNLLFLFNNNILGYIIILKYLRYKSNTFLDFINDNSVKYDNNENIQTINVNNLSSGNQDKEYKNKINELEKCIKELKLKIKEMDIIINEEKKKNEILNKKIKEFENKSNNKSEINHIIELENEIELFKKYNNFSEGERLISIKFISVEQDMNYSLIVKNTEIFSKIETMLYNKYTQYSKSENFFLVSGNKINTQQTFEQNNIKNNDIITLFTNDAD